jgi:hypothetical protein
MVRFAALTLVTMALVCASASAQVVYVQSPAPVVYAPPVTVYSSPVVTYSSPVVSAPVVSYYAPPVYTAPPVTYSYYPPVATAPVTVYSAPAVVQPVVPGGITTRSYVGLGIFRPRGVYTQSYWTPYP